MRPFARAAVQAGFEVTALDVFADADTKQAANQVFKIGYANGGFVAEEVLQALDTLNLTDYVGLVYGSGFETQPNLLESIAERLPLIGNKPIVVRNLKRALQFFTLLDVLGIQHPDVSFRPLDDARGWLQKNAGGSGGMHVMPAEAGVALPKGCYYQKEVQGIPVSALFLADGQQARIVGYNQQWVSAGPGMPYRYGGVVSQADLPPQVKAQLTDYAQKLTSAVGLRGLNSLDGVMVGDDLFVLEINPRLSSTFDLYQSEQANLFDLHVNACLGQTFVWPNLPKKAKARDIFYAPCNLEFDEYINWPEWVADIPVQHSHIAAENPVCTVLAEADSAFDAKELATARSDMLKNIINKFRKEE